MKNSYFSVVITTYNRGPLLKRGLKSLIDQTEEDWEAIIIDDGSIDNSEEIIQEYLTLFSHKIRYVKQENQGTVRAKNAGIALAKGKFVTFLDSDDEYHPSHLRSRKEMLEQSPAVQFLYGGVKVVGNQYVPDRHRPGQTIHLSACVIGGTFFLNRALIVSLKGFRPFPIGTDADLFERVKETSVTMMKTNLPTYVYRRETEDSITHRFLANIAQDDLV